MKHKIGNIVGIVLIILFLPVVIINTTLAIKGSLEPEKVATFMGYGPLIIETGSMRPAFKERDLLIIKECDASKLAEGDIIAYYDSKGTVVSHRIVGFDTDASGAQLYITRGDANNVQDKSPVAPSQVAGLAVHVIPDGGKAMDIARKPIVMGLVVAVPLALWFGYSALSKALDSRKTRKEGTAQANESQPSEPDAST